MRRRKYVDFDGVIKDTRPILFEDYLEKQKDGDVIDPTTFVIRRNWLYVLAKSPLINNVIETLNELDDVSILTRVHSLENESVAKIQDLRDLGVKCDIILVPYQVKKTDVVYAPGNILVDDDVYNLDEWSLAGGIPIFFDLRGTNADDWGMVNEKYVKTRSLDILKKY